MPFIVGSRIALHADGLHPRQEWSSRGGGALSVRNGAQYLDLIRPGEAQVIVSDGRAIASRSIQVLPPPRSDEALLMVACFDDGVAIYDASSLRFKGLLATGGSPSDIAQSAGEAIVTDNDGSALTRIERSPWKVSRIAIPLTDEVAADARGHFFATIREWHERGAVARIAARSKVATTGITAEGVAVDAPRHILYVANINDGSIVALDSRTLAVRDRIAVGERVYSLALSPDGRRLYATRNGGLSNDYGEVIALKTRPRLRVLARSTPLTLPLGVALDSTADRLFVTDEELNRVDVLDPRTLRPSHPPLQTCRTPWKPHYDARSDRLFIPCAQANEVDIFNATTLKRAPGAPLHTAGYPLAVAISRSVRPR